MELCFIVGAVVWVGGRNWVWAALPLSEAARRGAAQEGSHGACQEGEGDVRKVRKQKANQCLQGSPGGQGWEQSWAMQQMDHFSSRSHNCCLVLSLLL